MYILPVPQKTENQEGEFRLDYQTQICTCVPTMTEMLYQAIEDLKQEIFLQTGMRPQRTSGSLRENCIYICQTTELQNGTDPESYLLEAGMHAIVIQSPAEQGLLYGIQTLRQIIRQSGCVIACTKIEDYPEIANRGFFHDVTRGRIPKLETLKKLADKMCFYKLNQLQLYVEHTFMFQAESEVWRDDTPLQAADIIELDHYCKVRGIDLVPSIASFGHLYKVLRTKTFDSLCECPEPEGTQFSFIDRMNHHTLNAADPKALQYAKERIAEYASLFSSSYFNIGADETFDLGKGRSSVRAGEIGTDELYMEFVEELCNYVISIGKKPMFWGDVINKFPDKIKQLPKETICLNWGYAAKQTDEIVVKMQKAGAKQYVCPGVCGWNEWINLLPESYSNISRMCSYAHRCEAEGILNTDWGDYGHINQPDFSTAGMIYGAAFSWNSRQLPEKEINQMISVIEYGDSEGLFIEKVAEIGQYELFDWHTAVYYKEKNELLTEEITKEKLEQANTEILRIREELQYRIMKLEETQRYRIRAYLIAIDAICIWNDIGKVILSGNEKADPDGALLAEKLEKWFQYYCGIWREVSRESELWRVREVVDWYANFLRKK